MNADLPRGAVVIIADRRSEFGGKPRPAIVLQRAGLAAMLTVTVCLLTTAVHRCCGFPCQQRRRPAGGLGGCHNTSTKNPGGACDHRSSRCRSWATSAHAATFRRSSFGRSPSGRPPSKWSSSGWSLSGRSSPRPSAHAAATTRDTTTAAPWSACLALETRSLALEWPSLGLGSG